MIEKLHNRGTGVWSSIIVAIALSLVMSTSAQQEESLAGFVRGVRPNAVKGKVLYQRDEGKFDLEPGLRLQEGDIIRSSSDSYAELLLQPGNYLRLGGETEFQILSAQHDKMRLKLSQGTISIEMLASETQPSFSFPSIKQVHELIRIITPTAQIFIDQPGIFRIDANAGGQTGLIVRKGEAVINGQKVKQKHRAVAASESVFISEVDQKLEDSFDAWARERARIAVDANKSLKKTSPWAGKQKQERLIEFPDDADDKKNAVISAKPGAVNFFEAGVEVSRPAKEWEQLSDDWEFEPADKLRTNSLSFAELTLFPDIYLRLDNDSEIVFEQLSNDLISLKLLRGSAILDAARFESKESLPVTLSGPSTSVALVGEGNYRIDVKPNGDRIAVRLGKVIFNKDVISACRVISGGIISECDKQKTDNFDFWSEHQGEGKLIIGRTTFTKASFLASLRRKHFKKTGFWFQNAGQIDYTFVPYTSSYFRSPYGGNYSTALVPEHVPMRRVEVDNRPMFRLPGLPTRPPQP